MNIAEAHFVLDSNAAEVPDLQAKLMDWCEDARLDGALAGKLTLAVVEAVNNSIEHAYGDEPGHPIRLHCLRNRDGISVEVRDKGKRFFLPPENPELPNPDAEGGRGWAIIRQCTDSLSCVREGDENVLTLRCNL